ncbi:protein JINGUBANG [Ricinus communis]|uniref:protein JINGUBANG n=1 Tax=Ricinus communis TaxID=3988 RepID=UPI00201A8E6E|nr:protein JINGUBANG [Ricinus communis]
MGLLPCPLFRSKDKEQPQSLFRSQSQPHSNFLHSQSSTSSSLSSQPSLPSVPSLTPPCSQQHEQTSVVHHRCLAILKGHSYIFSLILDGNILYSGSSNSDIRSWSKDPSADENPTALNIIATSNGAVKSIVVIGDELFSAHQDCKIRVWKIGSNDNNKQHKYNCIATLPTMNDRFLRFFSSKNYVQVRRHKKCTWVHHVDTVSALAVSKDGSFLFSASWDRTFKIWRTSDFRCLESVANAHDDAINTLVLSNDGFVYTGSADKKIKVWKKQAGEKKHSLLATMEKHKSAVNALALSADGSVLYSGACDRSILVWEKDANVGGEMVVAGALRGHNKAILCLAVAADLICSGSAVSTIRIWRRSGVEKTNYSCLAVFEGHRKAIKCLTITGMDGKSISSGKGDGSNSAGTSYLVYSGSLDCDIRVWHIWVPIL